MPKVCSFNIQISHVACGDDHTVFVSSMNEGGYVYAMGSNADSKLGIGNSDLRSVNVPTLVEGICNIAKVACGTSHSVALGTDGLVYSWGQAFYGALGLSNNGGGSGYSQNQPQRIALDNVRDISAGGRHTFFMTHDMGVWCCGDAN